MESNGLPDEYVDTLVQEFAYDPIRLHVEEDPAQVLYDRTTLERIWDTKHNAINPYTRQPFDINRVVPQAELRQQMSGYILENRTLTLGLEVIPDYTNVLTTRDMENLLMDLSFRYQDLDCHCARAIVEENIGKMHEETYWKKLWKKFNLLRLYCQYGAENRETFSSIKGYEYLFTVIDDPLLNLCREYYDCCNYAKEVCREVARIVDIIGLEDKDLSTLPENSVWAFVHILNDLAESEYLKIQSMVLRIYRRMFSDCTSYLIIRCNIFCHCVVEITNFLLLRQNIPDITNEDLDNGSLILKAGWIKNSSLVLESQYYVDALVNIVIICISRFKNLHEARVHHGQPSSHNTRDDQAKNIYVINMALDQALSLIDCLAIDYPNENHSNVNQKERLQILDIVREIVRMVELELSGFQFMEASHFRFGFNIARALYKQGGLSVIRKKDVETFRRFLLSKNVDKYGKHVKTLLQGVIGDAEAEYLKQTARGDRRRGNRNCDVTNGSRVHR